MRVKYKIDINGGTSKGKTFIYKFSSTKDIKLIVGKDKATISYVMTVKYDVNDLISFNSKLFRDAYRKIYLLHLIINNASLNVQNIDIQIGKDSFHYNDKDEHFPFMFCVVNNDNLDLLDTWHTEEVENAIISSPKSISYEDLKYCALSSFLTSYGHKYEMDKFTCLWTSMNATYSFIAEEYENKLQQKYSIDLSANKYSDYKVKGQDACSICLLMNLIDKNAKKLSKNYINAHKKDFTALGKALLKLDDEQVIECMKLSYDQLINDSSMKEEYKNLDDIAKELNQNLFFLLLFDYPYYLRCTFLHGNISTLLISAYNDYEVMVLHNINIILHSFLNNVIPKLYEDGFYTEEMFESNFEYLKAEKKKLYKKLEEEKK